MCSVTSYPPVVELDWSHDGLPLTEDSPGVEVVTSVVPPSTVSTLAILAVNSSSTGEYTCTATNRYKDGCAVSFEPGYKVTNFIPVLEATAGQLWCLGKQTR